MAPYPDSNASSCRRVLVVGAGALGCAAALTLAREPGFAITLVDDDVVELSNLQRQVLYGEADLGRPKVEAAARRLRDLHGATVEALRLRLDEANGPALVAAADLVLDCTDDPAAKFLLGRLAAAAGRPWVFAGVARTGGQWLLVEPGASACLECLYPASAGAEATAEGCSALGILAPVAGVVGAAQAATAIGYLAGEPSARPGRLYLYEVTAAPSRRWRTLDIPPAEDCACGAFRHPTTIAAPAGATTTVAAVPPGAAVAAAC